MRVVHDRTERRIEIHTASDSPSDITEDAALDCARGYLEERGEGKNWTYTGYQTIAYNRIALFFEQ